MKFTIIPFVGTDLVFFGMTRDKVRSALGDAFEEFRKTDQSANTTDAFKGVHVYYDAGNHCEAMEFFKPSEVMFKEHSMMGINYSLGKSIIEANSTASVEDSYGLDASDLGIGLYAPEYEDDPSALIQAIFIYQRGYYDK
ncbi:MAG: hypothetical protein ACOYMG_27935 [Candidatus Methylumidiphilus sp.]